MDHETQERYSLGVAAYREAWIELETALIKHRQMFGDQWANMDNWLEIWAQIQPTAASINFDENTSIKYAREKIRFEDQTTPPSEDQAEGASSDEPPPQQPELERVRQWVSNLPDGEVEMNAWVDFLDSLDGAIDIEFLKRFRDEEVDRQYNTFETVSIDAQGNLHQLRRKKTKQSVEKLGDGLELVLLKIPGGTFQMGTASCSCEQPVRTVRVPAFYLSKHPITQIQWKAVAQLPRIRVEIGAGDSHFEGDNLPVECVSWAEANEFCARLSLQTGRPYRLPSEAEWEYACRARSTTMFAFGDTITSAVVNYDGNFPYGDGVPGIARGRTVEVGSLGIANAFGLCDMHGNVAEWCADEWHDTYSDAPPDATPWLGHGEPHDRVVRGGSWVSTAEVCRSSDRTKECADASIKLYYLGFRVARDLLPPEDLL